MSMAFNDTRSAGPKSGRQVFLQIVQLRVVAAVYYLCLLVATSRALHWYKPEDSLESWVHLWVRFTRQNLITGFTLLLAIALVEAWLQHRKHSGPALRWRGLALGLAAPVSVLLRHVIGRLDNPEAVFKWSWVFSTSLLWIMIGGAAYALLLFTRRHQALHQQLAANAREQERLRGQQLEAQLSALQAQIEPHFLFNTLAHVKRLYETAPERGRDMLQALIAYLRAALPAMRRSESTLGQELDLVCNYLSVLQMRMGERLRFTVSVEPGLRDASLPTLVLPTLVENAIKHGLAPLPEGGSIHISAEAEGEQLCVQVLDDGRGFSGQGGSGVGLANTRARLSALFGDRAALVLEAAEPRGVRVRLQLPLNRGSSMASNMIQQAPPSAHRSHPVTATRPGLPA